MPRKRGLSFKRGTIARRAREKVVKALKRSGKVRNPWAVANAATKRMSPSKRSKLAKRRG
jgi:hypothetical protein